MSVFSRGVVADPSLSKLVAVQRYFATWTKLLLCRWFLVMSKTLLFHGVISAFTGALVSHLWLNGGVSVISSIVLMGAGFMAPVIIPST